MKLKDLNHKESELMKEGESEANLLSALLIKKEVSKKFNINKSPEEYYNHRNEINEGESHSGSLNISPSTKEANID